MLLHGGHIVNAMAMDVYHVSRKKNPKGESHSRGPEKIISGVHSMQSTLGVDQNTLGISTEREELAKLDRTRSALSASWEKLKHAWRHRSHQVAPFHPIPSSSSCDC
jgi:hypothetical protein